MGEKDCKCGGQCCGHRRNMHRFMEPCLLTLLCSGGDYGYALAERLRGMGFSEDELNAGTLYRTLRKIEQNGWVSSRWKQSGKGPKRRVYQITGTGLGELQSWAEELSARRARIGRFLDEYEKVRGGKA